MLYEQPAGEVIEPWLDYNGHLSVPRYFDAIMGSVNDWFDFLGLGETYRAEENHSMFTVQSHWTYLRELKLGDPLRVSIQMVKVAQNKIQYLVALYHQQQNYLAATAEFLVIHVDMESRQAAPFSPQKYAFLDKIFEQHSDVELSQYSGGIRLR